MKIERFSKGFKSILSWIIFLITFYIMTEVINYWWGSWRWWYWESIIPILALPLGSLILIYILKKML